MKQIFVLLLCILSITSYAQVVKEAVKPVIKPGAVINQKQVKVPTASAPAPQKTTPPPAATNPGTTTPPPVTEPTYYSLTAVKAVITTGNDNKEMLSSVHVKLVKKGASWLSPDADLDNNDCLLYQHDPSNVFKNTEFKVNAAKDIDLITPYSAQYRPAELRMDYIWKKGLKLIITYNPNFLTDAWKIEKASIVIRVHDQHGKPHPTLDWKVIRFSKSKLLTNGDRVVSFETDPALFPLLL